MIFPKTAIDCLCSFFRYGDRAPVTILGRLFTVVWMILSLVLTNAFTAHLSSSLTADDISLSMDHFMGARVRINYEPKGVMGRGWFMGRPDPLLSWKSKAFVSC